MRSTQSIASTLASRGSPYWAIHFSGIGEEAQRDPPGHKVEFDAIVWIIRRSRTADDLIGGLGLSQIEHLAGEYAAVTPPLIRVLKRHGLGRGCLHQPGCVGKPIVTH